MSSSILNTNEAIKQHIKNPIARPMCSRKRKDKSLKPKCVLNKGKKVPIICAELKITLPRHQYIRFSRANIIRLKIINARAAWDTALTPDSIISHIL